MMIIVIISILISFSLAWSLAYWYFRRKIRKQTKKMVKVMKADELKLSQPEDAYEEGDSQFFSDLERAAFNLRRKYLRLKKNSKDEQAVYETMFSGLQEAIVTVNPDLKIISFNSSFMSMFQWAPLSPHTVHYLHDVIRDPSVLKMFKKQFELKNKPFVKSLSGFKLLVNNLPSVEDHQNWVLGVFYDTKELEKTEKIRVDFVANASHELRTPLTIIKGYADLLQMQVESFPHLKDLVNPIIDSSQNMKMLLDDLLDLSKLDHQTQVIKQKLSTKEISNEMMSEISSLVSMHNKKLIFRFDEDFVWAEHSSLLQVLRNLIVNAIRYSGNQDSAKNIEIMWSSELDQNFKKVTLLKVKDYGVGIATEHQSRVFERFYRVDKGRHRDQGGTGLGLALVKHHLISHGGEIELKTGIGQGCEFICRYPVNDEI